MQCKKCDAKLKYDANGSTSSMNKHLSSRHPTIDLEKEKKDHQLQKQKDSSSSTKNKKLKLNQATLTNFLNTGTKRDQHAFENVIGRMIVKDLQPVSVVEDEGFNGVVTFLDPLKRYKMPSRTHISSKVIPDLYNQVRTSVTAVLKGEHNKLSPSLIHYSESSMLIYLYCRCLSR